MTVGMSAEDGSHVRVCVVTERAPKGCSEAQQECGEARGGAQTQAGEELVQCGREFDEE